MSKRRKASQPTPATAVPAVPAPAAAVADPADVTTAITHLLDSIQQRYLADSTIIPLLLNHDPSFERELSLIGELYQSVVTSLQFGQYRRAVWYLQALDNSCRDLQTHLPRTPHPEGETAAGGSTNRSTTAGQGN